MSNDVKTVFYYYYHNNYYHCNNYPKMRTYIYRLNELINIYTAHDRKKTT